MANAILDKAVEQADLIDTWPIGKFRFISIDMSDAGPAPGAWLLVDDTMPVAGTARYTTAAAHGLVAGDQISLAGMVASSPAAWVASTAMALNQFRIPITPNGKKYRVVKQGTTGNSEPTSWPTNDGDLISSGSVIFRCEGPASMPADAGLWTVSAVPTTTTFEVINGHTQTFRFNGGFVANLSKTYLSEFAPPAARTALSAPLTGKVVLPGPVFDCNDSSLNLTVADSSEVILLLKTAALDADPDLPDTQQRIIDYFDTLPMLPIPANAGPVALPINNTADRLMRL